MSKTRRTRKRRPADTVRIFRILTGPVYHDDLYRSFDASDKTDGLLGVNEPVLHRQNPHKMPRNVAPLVCKIQKGDDKHGV